MASDSSIAGKARLKDIEEIAREAGIPLKYIEPWGRYKAKVDLDFLRTIEHRQEGKEDCRNQDAGERRTAKD